MSMTKRNKIAIWVVIIALAVAAFIIWDGQRWQGPQMAEEIQKEIDRLQKLIIEIDEDNQKVQRGEVSCILIYQPVCGKDGRTYSNDCFAEAAGVKIAKKGKCQPEGIFCGGIAGIQCPTGYQCQLEGNYPDAGGKCVKD